MKKQQSKRFKLVKKYFLKLNKKRLKNKEDAAKGK